MPERGGDENSASLTPFFFFADRSTRLFFEKFPTRLSQSDFSLPELNFELNDTRTEKMAVLGSFFGQLFEETVH